MTDKQYRLNKWGTRLLKNDKPLFDWVNEGDKIADLLNSLNDENKQLKQQKQQYKGQRDYLLFVIERTCSKELFEETKSYLKEVE